MDPYTDTAWSDTDALIAKAQELALEAQRMEISGPGLLGPLSDVHTSVADERRLNARYEESPFWSNEGQTSTTSNQITEAAIFSQTTSPIRQQNPAIITASQWLVRKPSLSPLKKTSSKTSPFFEGPTKSSPTKRLPGVVSCLPFPPLTERSFGIIQETLAGDPFWLLVAITFLIKTKGEHAIPVFQRIKEAFTTPHDIANIENESQLLAMMQRLGLSHMRLAYMQKYALAFLNCPPQAGVLYKVRNYDARDMEPEATAVGSEDGEAWEIGHMTQGKYAIDSWRIFCRDVLLGRALDWNGKGREGQFQPEWMRVLPTDKELRAFLLWMWMREGYEWDPLTGQKEALRDDMARAVNQGRVEWDDTGNLRIKDATMQARLGANGI